MTNLNIPTYYNLSTPVSVGLGLTNIQPVFKFGFYNDITNTERSIWDGAGDSNCNYLAAAEPLNVVSDSEDDTAAGTGAHTVTIHGLNAGYAQISETLTLQGQTPVTTTQSFLRCNRQMVETAGSGGMNAGALAVFTGTASTGTPDDTSKVYSIITAGKNQTLQCNFTIPVSHQGAMNGIGASSFGNSNAAVTVRLIVRPQGGVWQTKNQFVLTRGTWRIALPTPIAYAARSDMEMRAIRSTGSGNIDISAYMDLWLVPG